MNSTTFFKTNKCDFINLFPIILLTLQIIISGEVVIKSQTLICHNLSSFVSFQITASNFLNNTLNYKFRKNFQNFLKNI